MKLSVTTVAKKIGLPITEWPGNCRFVANLLLEKGVVKGKLRYGLWRGEISPDSPFSGRPFTHHGWVEREKDLVDPTRWVFEAQSPYIYIGPNGGEYDLRGDTLRSLTLKPCPVFDSKGKIFDYSDLSRAAKVVISELIPNFRTPDQLSIQQLFWLSNLSLDMYSNLATEIYLWIIRCGFKGFIPIDNRMEILGA